MFGESGLPNVLPVGYGDSPSSYDLPPGTEYPSNYPYPSGVPDRGGPNLRPSPVPGSGGGAGPGWNTAGLPAGYGATGTTTPSGPYIDKTDTGGYAYRFYKSGEIVIIATGNAKVMPIGRVLTSKDSAWSAIVSKFGTYEMQSQAQTQGMLTAAAPGVAAAIASAVGGTGQTFKPSKHSGKGSGGGGDLTPPPAESSSMPYWIIGGGVVVVGAVLLFALSGKNKGKE